MFFKYNWKGLLWALFILLLCGIPGSDIPHFQWMDFLSFDKFAHAGVFAVLVILGARGLAKQYEAQRSRSNPVLPVLLFALAYSPLTEWLQDIVFVERTAEFLDMLANWVGCFVGMWLYGRYFKYRSGAGKAAGI